MKSLSKKLSYYLRHNLDIFNYSKDGYVKISELREKNIIKKNTTIDAIDKIVKNDSKNRYDLKFEINNGYKEYYIRANQGHSSGNLDYSLILEEIKEPIPNIFHGTFIKKIDSIKNTCLNKMTRHFIHFAADDIIHNHLKRSISQVKVYVDMKKAMDDEIKFYYAKNKVILSNGKNNDGIIPAKYFTKIVYLDKS
ncbi:putative tRNA 2-phosphotransferase [Cafeteria roenbergensis virus]|uniref:Putative tRNA 2-phosphotransferase n=1 Tax=Cafeteria roenbergensis virus (strain BV-PW1) TaxID=693272 RepID=E3T4N2_CROVB|nr:RNA 2'-phosphotransferase [Cafeteria roenbergensis virus BV-PW1]ADO67145.1 putative tRNA 2-phosphotransferase [Cafeteria roenbergensis virus BV-PW1]